MHLVDIVLYYSRRDHCHGGKEKSYSDTLDRTEVDVHFAEPWVNDLVHKRDEYDDGNRVEVRDDVVRGSIELHGGCLRCEVVRHLSISEPVNSDRS